MKKKPSQFQKQYEDYLNEIGVPVQERKSEGGRIPDTCTKYGTWLRKHDPIAFQVGYQEWKRKA